MMTCVFYLLAALAFVGFFYRSKIRDGHGMAYSAVMVIIWIAAALWWSGKIG